MNRCGYGHALTQQIRDRLGARLFDVPIMQNQIRPLYVEALVEEALGPERRYVGANWGGWDFQNTAGVKLEVKQSAAKQPWSAGRQITTKPSFDIRERTGYYGEDGVTWTAQPGRPADLYIFAWHPVTDETADHRDPAQWVFFVVPATLLPEGLKTLGLKAIERFCSPVRFVGIKEAVAEACGALGRSHVAPPDARVHSFGTPEA